MKYIGLASIIFLSYMQTTVAESKHIEGVARVVDGDTLAIESAGERIRLGAIDVPEGGQTCDRADSKRYLCGPDAAEYLAKLVGRSGRVNAFGTSTTRMVVRSPNA